MEQQRTTYHEQVAIDNTLRLRDILSTLPDFCKDYFRAMDSSTSTRTRISYAYDIRVFFQFLLDQNPSLKEQGGMKGLTVGILDEIKAVDLEEFEEYLKVYKNEEDQLVTNGERGVKRKMSALRSFYAYYFKREMIKTNPTVLIDMPKTHQKNIIRLDADEVRSLLDLIERGGDNLTSQQRHYFEKTKVRDFAIVTLLLGTGLRVSECVGLDIEDVDFKNNAVKVTRKGGNEMMVYFGDEVEKALKNYLEVRNLMTPLPGHEHALFYSTQRRRIGVQAVENLVKKYAVQVTTSKHITPHKLRSTYGTALYQETGDIYLVADVLGHRDVNTTKRHYAQMDDERRRMAADMVRLRDKRTSAAKADDGPRAAEPTENTEGANASGSSDFKENE